MAERTVPAAIHMWFQDGDGWAYHPSLRDRFQYIVKAVAKHLKFSETREEFVHRHKQYTLVGETAPDYNCKDPKAVNRSPFILRVAYVRGVAPDDATLEFVREGLQRLRLPPEQGQCNWLEISLAVAAPAMGKSMAAGSVRGHGDRREPTSGNVQGNRVGNGLAQGGELQEELRLAKLEIEELTEEGERLQCGFNWAKSLVRSGKKALLVTLVAGICQLGWWPFGDHGLLEVVLGVVATTCALVGLYSTRGIKIFPWLV